MKGGRWLKLQEAKVLSRGFPGGSVVKNLPATQETQVQSLGWEDPLEEGMETHSSILAWRIPCIERPGGLQSMGSQRVRHDGSNEHLHTQVLSTPFHSSSIDR